jgi:predicted outer membrane protein
MRLQGLMIAMAMAALPMGAAAQDREASDDNDRAVHAFLSAVDLGEVQSSMLATQRATNAEVRSFAQSMIGDHSNALHTREMLMQTENSGLVQRMAPGREPGVMPHSNPAAGGIAGTPNNVNEAAGVPAQSGGTGAEVASGHNAHSSPTATGVAGQVAASGGTAHTGGEHAGHGNAQAGAAHAGHGSAQAHAGMPMSGLPAGVTPAMVQQLEATLTAHPMSRPVMEANMRNMQVLQAVTGPQFDKSYMDAQIGAHRYALSNIDRMLAQTGALGDDIRTSLQGMRTAVASHLQMAEQIRGRLQ